LPESLQEPYVDNAHEPLVHGVLHSPQTPNNHALILTHGAGSNCNAPLLVALAETFCEHGYTVLRCDLPFRQAKPFGPPFPAQAERDRAGLRNAVAAMRKTISKESSVPQACPERSRRVRALLLGANPGTPTGFFSPTPARNSC